MNLRDLIEDRANNQETEVMLLADLDEALLGTTGEGEDLRACYSEQKCYELLMRDHGMDRDGALEYFEYNILPLSEGQGGPAFIDNMTF